MSKSTSHAKRVPKTSKKNKKARKPTKKSQFVPQPKPGTPQFAKLQREWYAKLADSGFKDLENHMKYTGEAYPLLHGHAYSALQGPKAEETLHYYRRWTCFLSYVKLHELAPVKREIAKLWAQGLTIREIREQLSPKYKAGLGNATIHSFVKRMNIRIEKWNKKNPNGLDYKDPQEDSNAT